MPATSTRSRQQHHERIHAQIVASAREHLAAHGTVSVKAVAAELSFTAPALYRYVGSRDLLLDELAVGASADLHHRVRAAAGVPGDPAVRFVAIANAVREYARAHPHEYLLVHGGGRESVPDAAAEHERDALDAIADAATRGRSLSRRHAARERARSLWIRIHGLLVLELTGHLECDGIDAAARLDSEARAAAG